ncbi:glycosyltransferase family 2 protein [Patescibacteria group bacterium]|nr:glycosyltransferase family 2 protein [Patescibacteria group bacterium]
MTAKEKILNRCYEILPGLMVWVTLIGAVVISIFKPLWAITFIIIFDVFWLVRAYYLVTHLLTSWARFKRDGKIHWLSKLNEIKDKDWQSYYHLIFLPTFRESLEIINETFKNLIATDYPHKKFIIVLAGEERDKKNFLKIAKKLKDRYKHYFFKIIITVHPVNLPDEIPGKGSNLNYAGHQTLKIINKLRLPHEKIITSTFDIDTVVDQQYFSYLTYKYLTHPKPERSSFQPLAFYHNNIWESDPITRVVANSTTFWLMTDLSRRERLFTFSSHSMSFKALVDVDFWQKDIVSEDSRIFLQCLFRYNGDYRVTPLFISVSMNTVHMGNFWKSLSNQYKQMRRWAWGIEHIPYFLSNFKNYPKMPFNKKRYHFINQLEGSFSWATAPLLILILGRLPLFLADKTVQSTVLAQNTPFILETLMNVALIGLIITAVLSTCILPQKPKKITWFHYPVMLLQWILFPLTTIIFGSIPAIDSQTRLMIGGKAKLGFWVTEKK